MSCWGSAKAKHVLAALLRIGWSVKRTSGSHRTLWKEGRPNVIFAYHDGEELGPKILARIAKETGLTPDDLYLFHQGTHTVGEAKRYMAERGVRVREQALPAFVI